MHPKMAWLNTQVLELQGWKLSKLHHQWRNDDVIALFLRISWALEIISSRESIGTQTSVEYGFTLPSILPYIETKANQRLCLADQSLDRSSGLFDSDHLKILIFIALLNNDFRYLSFISGWSNLPISGSTKVKYDKILTSV